MTDKRKYTTVLIDRGDVLNLRIVSEIAAGKIGRWLHNERKKHLENH